MAAVPSLSRTRLLLKDKYLRVLDYIAYKYNHTDACSSDAKPFLLSFSGYKTMYKSDNIHSKSMHFDATMLSVRCFVLWRRSRERLGFLGDEIMYGGDHIRTNRMRF